MKTWGLLLASSLVFSVHAAEWINVTGEVVGLTTYARTNTILVTLDSEGAEVAECSNRSTFAISKDDVPEARSRMYSMLLAAKTAEKKVVLTYQNIDGCEPWDSNPTAYRKILRLALAD